MSRERPVRVREATNADRETLRSLHRRAITSVGSDPDDVPGNYLEDVEASFGDEGVLYVLERDGEVVAMGGAKAVDERTVELVRIAVDPEHHREGLGTRVVEELESFARDAGFEHVELETTERQEGARRLYESRAYEATGQRQFRGYTVVTFEKSL